MSGGATWKPPVIEVSRKYSRGVTPGGASCGNHAMAHGATDAVARQGAVDESRVAPVGELQEIQREIALAVRVGLELPLAHGAVTAQAHVGQCAPHRLALRRRQRAQERELALHLGEEDRIAAGQPHRRPPPFAVGRDVRAGDGAGRRRRRRQEHRRPERPVQSAVARHALAGADVPPAGGRRGHMIVRLRRQRLHVRERHARYRREGLQECGIGLSRGQQGRGRNRIGMSRVVARRPPP